MENEQRRIGASYIFNFYNDVQTLTDYYASYRNVLSAMRKKYPSLETEDKSDDQLKDLSDIDGQNILNAAYNVTFLLHKTYIGYKTLLPIIKIENEAIKKNYDLIKNAVLPNCDAVEEYVVALNQIIIDKIVQNILQTNQEIINQIYGQAPPPNEQAKPAADNTRTF